MKPLPVLLLTDEDMEIFARAFRRGPEHRWLYHMTQLADRRDAELMYAVEAVRANMTYTVEHVWYVLLKGYLYIDALGDFKVRE